MEVCRDAQEPPGCQVEFFSCFFFSLEKGKGGYILSLEELEVCKKEKDITNADKTMHKSCPCALADLKIVFAGGSTGRGRLLPERRVWVWTLTSLLCRFRECGIHPAVPGGLM